MDKGKGDKRYVDISCALFDLELNQMFQCIDLPDTHCNTLLFLSMVNMENMMGLPCERYTCYVYAHNYALRTYLYYRIIIIFIIIILIDEIQNDICMGKWLWYLRVNVQ